jgi:tRNA-2-methylthio-N6-dimethylallyladenosine synthase
MPELNLPIQSGHDHILKIMRRGYTVARYRELVGRIRAAMPHIAMVTDIIVGHPGEQREHFEATRALLEELQFDKVHIAAYSARPGTRAAVMEEDLAQAVPEGEKQARRHELDQLQEQIATAHSAAFLGQEVEVLVEGEHKGKWRGRTPGNKLVFFHDPASWNGRLARVRIVATGPWSLQGELV